MMVCGEKWMYLKGIDGLESIGLGDCKLDITLN